MYFLRTAFTVTALFLYGRITANAETPIQVEHADSRFLQRPDGRIAFEDNGGHGPLLVLVPGMEIRERNIVFLSPALIAAGYRVVTLDIRGHGDSTATWPDYSAHAVATDVLALISQLGGQPAVVMGTSFAAGSALWAAHDQPANIRGLVLISPVVRDLPVPFYMRPLLKLMFASPWRVGFWMSYWDGLFPTRRPADQTAYRERLVANLSEPGRFDALEQMVFLSKADTEAILDQVHKPTLLIMGSKDADFADPAAEAHALAERIAASVLIVDKAGHYPQAEMPEKIIDPLKEFLKGLP